MELLAVNCFGKKFIYVQSDPNYTSELVACLLKLLRISCIRGHSFSTYVEFSGKLTFLSP